eukprot:350504-Chlamydomonas_euryale.AAC.2
MEGGSRCGPDCVCGGVYLGRPPPTLAPDLMGLNLGSQGSMVAAWELRVGAAGMQLLATQHRAAAGGVRQLAHGGVSHQQRRAAVAHLSLPRAACLCLGLSHQQPAQLHRVHEVPEAVWWRSLLAATGVACQQPRQHVAGEADAQAGKLRMAEAAGVKGGGGHKAGIRG